MSRLRRGARHLARCAAGIIEDEVSLRASSLTFSILFCLAPIGAMLLGLSAMFPKAFYFLPELYARLAPRLLPRALEQAVDAAKLFAANAENISIASMALFAISALSLSMQLEKCVQRCWGPQGDCDTTNPLARHWLALTLTPCAMALLGWAAFGALSLSPTAESGWGASFGLLFGFFLIATWALPADRPRLAIASAASALATVECLAIQAGFSYAWSMSQSYGVIYGAAAVFIGALLWIWLFWTSLLSSVSLASTLLAHRPRDLCASGLGFIDDWLGPAPARIAPRSASEAPPILFSAATEAAMLDALGSDPAACATDVYAELAGPSSTLSERRAALGAACAARAGRAMIESTLAPLANASKADNIQIQTSRPSPLEDSSHHEPKT